MLFWSINFFVFASFYFFIPEPLSKIALFSCINKRITWFLMLFFFVFEPSAKFYFKA